MVGDARTVLRSGFEGAIAIQALAGGQAHILHCEVFVAEGACDAHHALGRQQAPDGEGVVEVLSAACLLFFWAADPFASAVNRPDVTAQIKQELARFGTLPGAFPGMPPKTPHAMAKV